MESGSWLWSKERQITMGTFILPATPHHTFPSANQEVQLQHQGHMGNVGSSRRREGRTKSFLPRPLCLCHFPCLTLSASFTLTVFLSLRLCWLTLLFSFFLFFFGFVVSLTAEELEGDSGPLTFDTKFPWLYPCVPARSSGLSK